MTNWQAREDIIFTCPDCGHEQREMTETCQNCGRRRLPIQTSNQQLYHFRFWLNRGMRREEYLIYLTDSQFKKLSKNDAQNVYESLYLQLWDQVVDSYNDLGCDFDAMMFKAEAYGSKNDI
jgi:hypothetical protein